LENLWHAGHHHSMNEQLLVRKPFAYDIVLKLVRKRFTSDIVLKHVSWV